MQSASELTGEGRLMLSSRAIPEFIWECSAVRHSLGFWQECSSFGIFCSSAYFQGMRAEFKLIFQTRHGDTAGVGGFFWRSLLFHLQPFLDPEVHAA